MFSGDQVWSTLRELARLLCPILAGLLVILSPMGTGQGSHRDQLLDPLFPHIHLGDSGTAFQAAAAQRFSRLHADQQPVQARGPLLGAGAGAAAAGFSAGLTPPVPRTAVALPIEEVAWYRPPASGLPRGAQPEAPPDPPPTRA